MLPDSILHRASLSLVIATLAAAVAAGPQPGHGPRCATRAHDLAPHLRGTLAGSVLEAAPDMNDPTFTGARIFLLAHDEDGALGVVVNGARVADGVWRGGPVGFDRVITLVDAHAAPDDSVRVTDDVAVLTSPDALEDELVRAHARAFVGYAGWAPGQLEAELRMGAWRVVPGTAHDALDAPRVGFLEAGEDGDADERDPFDSYDTRDPFVP